MNLRPSIQVAVLLCIALLFIGCAKEVPIVDQAADKLVIEGTLEVGQPINDFRIHGLRGVVEDQPQNDLQ